MLIWFFPQIMQVKLEDHMTSFSSLVHLWFAAPKRDHILVWICLLVSSVLKSSWYQGCCYLNKCFIQFKLMNLKQEGQTSYNQGMHCMTVQLHSLNSCDSFFLVNNSWNSCKLSETSSPGLAAICFLPLISVGLSLVLTHGFKNLTRPAGPTGWTGNQPSVQYQKLQ